MCVTPDGTRAVTIGEDAAMHCWDTLTGMRVSSAMQAHPSSSAQWAQVTADGGRVLSGGGNRRVVSWVLPAVSSSSGAAESSTGAGVVAAGAADAAAAAVVAPGGELAVLLPEQQGSRTKCVAFGAGGTAAAVLLYEGSVAVYNLLTGVVTAHLIKRGERDASRVHSSAAVALYLTRDGGTAVTVSKDCTARVWDVAAGATRHVLRGHTDGIVAADISADERAVATVSYDGTARVWNLEAGQLLRQLAHDVPLAGVAFSPCGRRLLTRGEGPNAWVWDLSGGGGLVLSGHKEAVTAACWSADGRLVATAAGDQSAMVWEAATGRLLAVFLADAAATSVQFAGPAGGAAHTLVVGDAGGRVHFLELPASVAGGAAHGSGGGL